LRVSFVIPGVEPGCIAEFRFVMRGKYKSSWYEPWYFQNEYYTCTSTLDWKVSEWVHSNGLVPSWRLRNIADSRITETIQPSAELPNRVVVTAHSLPGTRNEEWAPPNREADPVVVTYYLVEGQPPLRYWELWKNDFEAWGRETGDRLGDLEPVVRNAA